MRNLAILGLLAMELTVMGCGTNNNPSTTATATGGLWESALVGTNAGVEVFNFTTAFTINGDGSLSISYLSFLTTGPCFPLTGNTSSGSISGATTGTTASASFQMAVQSGNATLALTGTATGTTDSSGVTTWNSITGTWTLMPATGVTGCTGSGSFTMAPTTG